MNSTASVLATVVVGIIIGMAAISIGWYSYSQVHPGTVTTTITPATPPEIVASCAQEGNPSQQISCSLGFVEVGDLVVVEFVDVATPTLFDTLNTRFVSVAQVGLPTSTYLEYYSFGRIGSSGADVVTLNGSGFVPSMIVRVIHGASSLDSFSTGTSASVGATTGSSVSAFSPPIGTLVLAAVTTLGPLPNGINVTQGPGYYPGITTETQEFIPHGGVTDEYAVSSGPTTSPFSWFVTANWAEISAAFG